jgi:tripartite ATP-independent transporter DctP family solute receptor
MDRIARRTALKSLALFAVASPTVLRVTRLHAAEFTMKLANNVPATHPLSARMVEATDAIRQETNGRVDIRVFPSNQLGSDTDSLSQLRSGALEFFNLSPLILQTLVPNAAISGIGFAWSGYDKVWPAMDGELGAYVRGQIEKVGLFTFEKIWDNGFRQVTSSTKPILTPDDLKNFKIRVPVSPLWTSMFRALDAAPTSINFNEVYSALQTRVVEGQENPIALITSAKFYEVQKYLSKTNHMWDGYWLLASGRVWNKLPQDVREVIQKHANEKALAQREDLAKLNNSLERELAEKGMQVSNVDGTAFRAKLQSAGFYKEWRQKFGDEAWKLLEKHAGAIS